MLSRGRGIVSDKLGIVLLCKQMQWDYHTYLKQPTWFLDLIRLTTNLDAEYQEKLNRQLERQARRRK